MTVFCLLKGQRMLIYTTQCVFEYIETKNVPRSHCKQCLEMLSFLVDGLIFIKCHH
eukprot:TRINITY_DN4190_c2_g1_i1.p2 TRINITY_DN4190_c2_g1~~TRINITY_DN4190_c2_g1_i1.p2  ORF type:complete len:56 (+),score=0.91 TRINITY_DN4190_c2_g1_i1:161-328(+)